MFRKLLLALTALLHTSTFAFTIINQTDSEKVIKLQEAYRQKSNTPGTISAPEPYGYEPLTIRVPANSSQTVLLRAHCSTLIVGVITKDKDGRERNNKTCYDPYCHRNNAEYCFTDKWGLVIHKPCKKDISYFDPDCAEKLSIMKNEKKNGYSIKCLHPKLIRKTIYSDSLPIEIQKKSEACQSHWSKQACSE